MLRFATAALVLLALAAPLAGENDHRPIWMPDARSVIFMSDREGGDWELFRIGVDGRNLTRLTEHAGWDGYADVSPDGRWLIFDRRDDEAGARIIKLDLESGVEQTLVQFASSGGGGRWSPDGQRIAFWREEAGARDLFIVDADGSHQTQVTRTPVSEHEPVFSPLGDRLMAMVTLDQGTAVDVMALDGSSRTRVMTSPGRAYGLAWSPDGTQVAFNAAGADDRQHLFLMRPDGTNRRALTEGPGYDHLPVWSPDGTRLIFTREIDEQERVMILELRTGRVTPFATN